MSIPVKNDMRAAKARSTPKHTEVSKQPSSRAFRCVAARLERVQAISHAGFQESLMQQYIGRKDYRKWISEIASARSKS